MALWKKTPEETLNQLRENGSVISPATARSFGAVNRTVLDFIKDFAQNEGVILDPVYSAKVF